MQNTIHALVSEVRQEAVNIVSLKLVSADSAQPRLPCAEAGSHIDLLISDQLRRSYSLLKPSNGTSYEVAVQLEENGRGGSRYLHEQVSEGMTISISPPRNNFPIREHLDKAVLVAGGIGITPIMSMLQVLLAQDKDVHLIYCTRSRKHAAFLNELAGIAANSSHVSVDFLFEDTHGKPELIKLLSAFGPDHHYYCCGPAGMLGAFELACTTFGYSNYFVERFAAVEDTTSTQDAGYQVELARSGKLLQVPAGRTLLDVLLDAGVDIAYSCQEGACGSCETTVLEGEIDHRDCLLSEEERIAGKTMLVCVSGCKSRKLRLDL